MSMHSFRRQRPSGVDPLQGPTSQDRTMSTLGFASGPTSGDYRRLRFENLEARNAPSVFFAVAAGFGLSESLLASNRWQQLSENDELGPAIFESLRSSDQVLNYEQISSQLTASQLLEQQSPNQAERHLEQLNSKSSELQNSIRQFEQTLWDNLDADVFRPVDVSLLDTSLFQSRFEEASVAVHDQVNAILKRTAPNNVPPGGEGNSGRSLNSTASASTAGADSGGIARDAASAAVPTAASTSQPNQANFSDLPTADSSAPTPPTAVSASASELSLVDADGQSLNIDVNNENTIVVGAATWCSACANLKERLNAPDSVEQLAGLNIVFAFGDEGGTGPRGVRNVEFLQNLPGQVAFLGEGSPRPDQFPSVFNADTGQFDLNTYDSINAWLADSRAQTQTQTQNQTQTKTSQADTPNEQATDAQALQRAADYKILAAQMAARRIALEATDGASPAAIAIAALTEPDIEGDFNLDRRVDDADLALWKSGFGLQGSATFNDGDADADSDVDGNDFLKWQRNFGIVPPPAAFAILTPLTESPDTTPTITWEASEEADTYDITIYADSSYTTTVQTIADVATTSLTLSALASGSYFVSVIASGNSQTTPATNDGLEITVLANYQVAFVTNLATGVSGDRSVPPAGADVFGGIPAADWVCSFNAAVAGLPGTSTWDFVSPLYQAVLSDSGASNGSGGGGVPTTNDAIDRLVINSQLYTTDNQLIANDKADFFDDSIEVRIVRDEFGNLVNDAFPNVWSGQTAAGIWTGQSCNEWDDGSSSGGADVGIIGGLLNSWILGSIQTCNESAHLYCISPEITQ